MTVILYIVGSALLTGLILLAATVPPRARISLFELRRRKEAKSQTATNILRREELLTQLATLKAPLSALIIIALLFTLIHLFGRSNGLIITLLIGLFYSRIGSSAVARRLANDAFKRYEAMLFRLAEKYQAGIRLIGGKGAAKEASLSLSSHEELVHVLEASDSFSDEDRSLLKHALRFKERKVKQLMVPRDEMVTVPSTELLGPLVLDDLHKTGHTIFPVTKGKDIVGLLDSSDHVALRTKESVHVRSVMHTDIAKIDQSTRLDEALRLFISTKQSLLIVVDDNQVVGLLSLGDTIRALTGWKQ